MTNTNNANAAMTVATFHWPGLAQPVLEGQLWHLEYLGYEGIAPLTYDEANALIERLIELTNWSGYDPLKEECDEDQGDGFTLYEHQEARRKFLHDAEYRRMVEEAYCRMKGVGT